MKIAKVQAFVDGGHLRSIATAWDQCLISPYSFCSSLNKRFSDRALTRCTYYDSLDENPSDVDYDMDGYLNAIAAFHNTHVGFGSLRGSKRRQQKGVDVLLSVQMLVGAVHKNFDFAILVAGDGDFVPAVEEVQRFGVNVYLLSSEKVNKKISDDLLRAVDGFYTIENLLGGAHRLNSVCELESNGCRWKQVGKVIKRT